MGLDEIVDHRFGIDVYWKKEYQGTNYIDYGIDVDEEELITMFLSKGEELRSDEFFLDTYSNVYSEVIEKEREKWIKAEYPYQSDLEFSDYSFKILV